MSEIKYQFFDKVDEPYGWCSNFYQLEKGLDIDGEKWRDVESYFQAMKFRKSGLLRGFRSLDYSLLIRQADSPLKAAALGRQKPLDGPEGQEVLDKSAPPYLRPLTKTVNELIEEYRDVKIREDWDEERLAVMAETVFQKFKQNPGLKEKIMSLPDDTLLVEHCGDCFWGDGMDGGSGEKGLNFLGTILTIISLKLKYGCGSKEFRGQIQRLDLSR